MKKLLIILLCLNFINSLNAQSIFQHGYGNNRNERCQSIWPTKDGGYLLNGASTSFGNGDVDALIVRVDALGNILWSNSCGTAANEIPTYAVETFDNKFTFIGSTDTSAPGTLTNGLLFKTDSAGNFLWAKSFGGINSETATKIIELPDHGYAITGSTESYGSGSSDIYFMRTDQNGDTLFTRIYGSADNEASKSMTTTRDGGYIICGKSSAFISGQLVITAFLVRIDSTGNLLWSKLYGDSLFQEAQSVVETADSGFIVCGSRDFTSNGNYDILLFKTDISGNIQWSKTYGGNKGEGSYAVHLNEDGTYVLSGYTNSMGIGHRGDDSTNIFLMKTDAWGDTLWTRTYGDSLQEEAFLSEKTLDGGFILSGFSDYHNADSSQMFVIKTDDLGFSGCYTYTSHPVIVTDLLAQTNANYIQTSGMNIDTLSLITINRLVPDSTYCLITNVNEIPEKYSYKLFPNPVTDRLFVSFHSKSSQLNNSTNFIRINVYNIVGEQISAYHFINTSGNYLELDISSLMQGIYLLEIQTQSETIIRKFIKSY